MLSDTAAAFTGGHLDDGVKLMGAQNIKRACILIRNCCFDFQSDH